MEERATRMERRLALPVVAAAMVSVPAVFLTTLGGTAAQAGTVLNWLSLLVLTGESLVLLAVSNDRVAWLRRHRWMVAVALLTVPAVVLAVGPVQLLRLVRFVGAVRLLRVNRILKAGRILRARANLEGAWRNAIAVGVTVLAAAFAGLVLADPTSQSRQWVEWLTAHFGYGPAVVAGLVLGGATFVVLRQRAARTSERTPGRER